MSDTSPEYAILPRIKKANKTEFGGSYFRFYLLSIIEEYGGGIFL
jgi:hypothetical protein